MLEAVAPSCLNISPWRATRTLFVVISIVCEGFHSGPVYYVLSREALQRKRGRPNAGGCVCILEKIRAMEAHTALE